VLQAFGGDGDPAARPLPRRAAGRVHRDRVDAPPGVPELGPHGVRAVTLRTDGVPQSILAGFDPQRGREITVMLEKMTMLGRTATLQDVGDVAACVASDRARTMTAAMVNIQLWRADRPVGRPATLCPKRRDAGTARQGRRIEGVALPHRDPRTPDGGDRRPAFRVQVYGRPTTSSARDDVNFIKRVVAGPDDRLAITDGHVVRNGRRQVEPLPRPAAGDADATSRGRSPFRPTTGS
jgi:hypothetical protein